MVSVCRQRADTHHKYESAATLFLVYISSSVETGNTVIFLFSVRLLLLTISPFNMTHKYEYF
jgi:hypothetical protein